MKLGGYKIMKHGLRASDHHAITACAPRSPFRNEVASWRCSDFCRGAPKGNSSADFSCGASNGNSSAPCSRKPYFTRPQTLFTTSAGMTWFGSSETIPSSPFKPKRGDDTASFNVDTRSSSSVACFSTPSSPNVPPNSFICVTYCISEKECPPRKPTVTAKIACNARLNNTAFCAILLFADIPTCGPPFDFHNSFKTLSTMFVLPDTLPECVKTCRSLAKVTNGEPSSKVGRTLSEVRPFSLPHCTYGETAVTMMPVGKLAVPLLRTAPVSLHDIPTFSARSKDDWKPA